MIGAIVSAAWIFLSQTQAETPPAPSANASANNASPTSDAATIVSDSRPGMGTRMQILVFTSDTTGAKAAIEACFTELARLEQLLSEWIPTSDISRVNQAAGRTAAKVSPEAIAVVAAGKEAAERTQGGFAMTWLSLSPLWKIPPAKGDAPSVPTKADVARLLPLVGDKTITVDATAGTVSLPTRGMAIGVGAIGKGYAMDRIADLLSERGFPNVLVSAGGDVVARGSKGAKPWSVGLQDPRGPGYYAVLPLKDQAISTAGDYERYFELEGVRYHHIIDPRTGFPARGTRSVTVISDRGMLTDALDTGLFVLGPEEAMKLVEADPRIQAVIVDEKNNVTISKGLSGTLRVLRSPTP